MTSGRVSLTSLLNFDELKAMAITQVIDVTITYCCYMMVLKQTQTTYLCDDMVKKCLLVFAVLVMGVFAGMFWRDRGEPLVAEVADEIESTAQPLAYAEYDMQRIEMLESLVLDLHSRVETIEAERPGLAMAAVDEVPLDTENPPFAAAENASPTNRSTSIADNLIRAGIDQWLAEDIVQRIDTSALKKLELRHKATRQGYLGTQRFREESKLLDVSIQKEVGDDNFDRYLFASGQTNRVAVNSVMTGSAAEQAGVVNGDLILSYDQHRLFNVRELVTATTEGNRYEWIDIIVERDGSVLTLSIPRGPLGVRLIPTRVNPNG